MPGASVTFAIVDDLGHGTASFPGGATKVTTPTDARGIATAPTITAGTTTGPILIYAEHPDVAAAQYVLQVDYPAPATFTAVSGGDETAVNLIPASPEGQSK